MARRPLAAGAEGPTSPGRRDLSVGLYTYSTLPRGSVTFQAYRGTRAAVATVPSPPAATARSTRCSRMRSTRCSLSTTCAR